MGFQDTKNVSGRIRSGYELVRADEYPDSDFQLWMMANTRVIGVGGLVLARVPEEIANNEQTIMKQAQDNVEAVDNDLMKEQHPSMPINIDRQTRVTFGGSKKS